MKYFIKDFEKRYFAGLELPNGMQLNTNNASKIKELWQTFMSKYAPTIPNQVSPKRYIGLEIYPFDFKETGAFDYYALTEINALIDPDEMIVTKKLKPGRYICFPIKLVDIMNEIQKVYAYIKEKEIQVHMGFDYEEYIAGEDYRDKDATLNFCLLLEDHVK